MDKAQNQSKDKSGEPEDATPKAQAPSPEKKEPSPQTPQTYPKEEVDRLINLTKMEAGRETKTVTLERDNLKSQLDAKNTELENIKEELAKVEKLVDDMASNDPERDSLEKRAKELREEARQNKSESARIAAEKQANEQTVKEIQEIEKSITVWNIAELYSGGDETKQAQIADKLMDLAESLGATDEDKIQSVAKTIFGEAEIEPLKVYSGKTSGGDEFFRDKKNPTKTLEHGFKKLKQRT